MASGQLGGSTPQLNRGPQVPGYKALYYSLREIALIKDKTCQAGYGVLRAGTIMAENVSTLTTGGKGELVPYPVASFVAGDVGRALILGDVAADAVVVNVTQDDSYKFNVGDDLILADSTGRYNCGAIASINRTEYPHYAIITFPDVTTVIVAVADGGCGYVVSGLTDPLADPFATAKYVLDKDVDTGVGESAQGANTPVLVSNAILYTNSLVNCDAAAIVSLGMTEDGQHVILK